ncbi:MAG TPA: methyltransferase domain-containing protein [Allosphingosinicella sp.]|nr:methyltransferase domain-containing protein [Allosphingosinicella sp.]
MTPTLKSGVSAEGVAAYKAMSDENRRVSEILVSNFADMVSGPIVDVGCGLGDIAAGAWADRDVLLIDILDYPDNRDADRHKRLQADFFDEEWSRDRSFATILLAHVLQYVDSPLDKLHARLTDLHPQTLITVTEVYDRQFSEIVEWAAHELVSINPEYPGYPFPGFDLIRETEFEGNLTAESFPMLASLFAEVVLDRRLRPQDRANFSEFLTSRLDTPSISLRQVVRGYRYVE